MLFNFIVNPESGRKVSIYGKTGKRVLTNYLKYLKKVGGKKNHRKRRYKKYGGTKFKPTSFTPTKFTPTEFTPTEFTPTEFIPTNTQPKPATNITQPRLKRLDSEPTGFLSTGSNDEEERNEDRCCRACKKERGSKKFGSFYTKAKDTNLKCAYTCWSPKNIPDAIYSTKINKNGIFYTSSEEGDNPLECNYNCKTPEKKHKVISQRNKSLLDQLPYEPLPYKPLPYKPFITEPYKTEPYKTEPFQF